MTVVTAQNSAVIEFPGYWYPDREGVDPDREKRLIDRYLRFHQRNLHRNVGLVEQFDALTGKLQISEPNEPSWLTKVHKGIQDSIIPEGQNIQNDGRWLSLEVSDAACAFFSAAANALPGEPYIYASLQGDLVAEFEGEYGNLTIIISPNFSFFYASGDGESRKEQLDRTARSGEVQGMVRQFTDALRTGDHGSLVTKPE